jgi:transcriptional regulator with XRE-family HTH domain
MELNQVELGKAREALSLSLTRLAGLSGYARTSWSQVLNGRHWPEQATMNAIADRLGVDADCLAIAIAEKRISKRK